MAALHTMNSSVATAASSVTQLEFHQAMNDFKIMFPSMDEDVIECVLRANNGAVDSTIDQLLQMASDLEKGLGQASNGSATTSMSSSSGSTMSKPVNQQRNQLISIDDEETLSQTPPPSYHMAVPSDSVTNSRIKNCNLQQHQANSSAVPVLPVSGFSAAVASNILSQKVSNNSLRARFKWNPPMIGPLPDTFLRFPDRVLHHHPVLRQGSRELVRHRSHSDRLNNSRPNVLSTSLLQQKMEENEMKRASALIGDADAQYLDDERLAILVQNEEFVRELRNNKEFMSQLQQDSAARSMDERDGSGGASGGATGSSSNFSDAAFREMLKNMSKMSRKKFAQVAGMFRKRNRSEGSAPLSSPNRHMSKDHLLASHGKDDEYREFQNDDTDSEGRHTPAAADGGSNDPFFVGIRSPDRTQRQSNNSGFRL